MRARDHDRYLATLYAPAAVRPALMVLWGLDLELEAVVAGTSEPMIGAIRLAWWREALEALDTGRVPAQPLLRLIAAELIPRGVSGADLAGLEDRWAGLIGSELVPPEHIEGGGDLFVWAAQLLDGDPGQARRLGIAWAGSGPFSEKVATPLRPLLGLQKLVARDAARARRGAGREAPGNPSRQLRLLGSIAFGL